MGCHTTSKAQLFLRLWGSAAASALMLCSHSLTLGHKPAMALQEGLRIVMCLQPGVHMQVHCRPGW